MIESFPFSTVVEDLEKKDFIRFAGVFSQVVTSTIPAVEGILFIEDSSALPKIFTSAAAVKKVAAALQEIKEGARGAIVVCESILLPFHLAEANVVVAVLNKVDSVLLEKIAEDWLSDIHSTILQEFLAIKGKFQDPETGLLNSPHLFSVLPEGDNTENNALLLVELPPPRRMIHDAFRSTQRAAAVLASYLEAKGLLHHLGQSVFCLVLTQGDIDSFEHVSAGLVQSLKKEGFHRVHVGSSWIGDGKPEGEGISSETNLLDEAWTALKVARRRGPFSFCDYKKLANAESHPLRVASFSVLRKLQGLSKRDSTFCLMKLSPLPADIDVLSVMTVVAEDGVYFVVDNDDSVFLYLSGYTEGEALDYAHDKLALLREQPELEGLYCGVSVYPFEDFTKSETLKNVQKALQHAAFFGPGHAVLFDALSLNVSGDIYFSDGDLPKAVLEYKRGLVCDENDVNLLNSLGVAYALLNRNSLARKTFDRVLELDEHDYMALYNLGLGAQQRGMSEEAISWFEKADRWCDDSEESGTVRTDLRIQLGTLYCKVGKFEEALHSLEQWMKDVPKTQHGRIFRLLGQAYLGTDNSREAMKWLQRALQYNELDAEAMSLLGTAIIDQQEGDDIGLSLCLKGVELAPENPLLHLRLAKAEMQNGRFREVLRSLRRCNVKRIDKGEVHLLKAEAYAGLKQSAKAKQWAEQVLLQHPSDTQYYKRAEKLYKAIE